MIRFSCPTCALMFETSDDKVDERFACPKCGQHVRVPVPSPKTVVGHLIQDEPPSRRQTPASMVSCPICGANQDFGPEAAGRWVECSLCQSGFAAPGQPETFSFDEADYRGFSVTVNNLIAEPSGGVGIPTSLALGSLVLGIVGFFVCWVPLVGLVLSTVGLLLAALALFTGASRNWEGVGIAIAGATLNLIALLIGLYMVTGLREAFRERDVRPRGQFLKAAAQSHS